MQTSGLWRKALAWFVILAGGVPRASGDDRVPNSDGGHLARLMAEWEQQSKRWTSVELSFTGVAYYGAWKSEETFSGRVALQATGETLVELATQDSKGRAAETMRMVWAGQTMYQAFVQKKVVYVRRIAP